MGFVTGFTGGVTLTLSVAYLTTLAHQRNREQQAATLRSQSLAIQDLINPVHPPLPPTRAELAAAERAHSVEAIKDRWNSEIENAARWVQHIDWDEVRQTTEASVSKLFGYASEEVKPYEEKAKSKLGEAEKSVADKAKIAYAQARQAAQQGENAAVERAAQTKVAAKDAIHKAESSAKEVKSETKGWFASAVSKGKEIASGVATTPIGVAEVEIVDKLPAATPVEKALRERYLRPEAKHNKTVEEALKERYLPMEKRDNTVLRGV